MEKRFLEVMRKTANQIADEILEKLSRSLPEKEKELPGYLALRGSPTEMAKAVAPVGLGGAPFGAITAGFSPGIARAIPSDKLRLLLGLLGGAGLGVGVAAGTGALGQILMNLRSNQLEKQLRESGQI